MVSVLNCIDKAATSVDTSGKQMIPIALAPRDDQQPLIFILERKQQNPCIEADLIVNEIRRNTLKK